MFPFKIKRKGTKNISKKISNIIVGNAISITSDAIELAVQNNIDILFLDKFGYPYGRVWHPKLGSTSLIRRYQLEWGSNENGFELVKEWILKKIANQESFLENLQKARPQKKDILENYIQEIESVKKKITILVGTLAEKRMSIMGYEGSASRSYFNALSDLMPSSYKFEGRSRQPAKDGFNCLLNYAYGVLYGKVEKACIIIKTRIETREVLRDAIAFKA